MLSATELKKLRQHHHHTIGLFIAFWVCVPCVIIAIEFLDLSERVIDSLLGVLFGAAIVAVLLQFSCRCPKCTANLGWQYRLGVPSSCRRCGVALREAVERRD